MVNFIESLQLFSANGEEYRYPKYPSGLTLDGSPVQFLIPGNATLIGYYWRVPVVQGGVWVGTSYQAANNSATKPFPDAAKVMKLQYPDNRIMFFYVADADGTPGGGVSGSDSTFAYYANGLGGSLPTMPTVTVPLPIIQQAPITHVPISGGFTNTFYFSFPSNANSRAFRIDGIWLDGLVPSPTMPTDKTTTALFATWANSNLSDYGTWAAVNATTLSLVSDPSDTTPVLALAGMVVSLIPVVWCFDLTAFSTPAAVNGLKLGSAATMPMAAFMLTDNNAVLLTALKQAGYLRDAIFSTAVAHKLQITTTQATPKLYDGVTLISTAGSGACA